MIISVGIIKILVIIIYESLGEPCGVDDSFCVPRALIVKIFQDLLVEAEWEEKLWSQSKML